MIELSEARARLTAGADTIGALLRGVDDEQARWKPTPERWSMLEVISHLADEEREDFRVRVEYIINRPGEVWPKIDPEGWVTSRNYAGRDFLASLKNFAEERAASLAWLSELRAPDWDKAYEHPSGPLRAGDIMAAWIAHDLLHIRQILKLHYDSLDVRVGDYSLAYAGRW